MKNQQEETRHDEFLRLYSRFSSRIYQFILTLVMSHADADEIFQDTSLVLWRKFETYDPEGSFYGWACRIAYLEVLQLRRKGRRIQSISEEALAVLADKALAQSEELDARQQALEHCLEKLEPSDRALVEQRYHQRLTTREIAQASARSVYSVYRALARVHSALLRCVDLQLAREG